MKNLIKVIVLVIMFSGKSMAASLKLHENFLNYYKADLRYSLMSIAKEILTREPASLNGLEDAMEEIVLVVGSKNFQGFSIEQLSKHRFNFVHYIIARKYFQAGQLDKAENSFKRVNSSSRFYAMTIQALATIAALNKQQEKAQLLFDRCSVLANKKAEASTGSASKQYQFVNYQCVMGKARVIYGMRKYKEAEAVYMTLSKKSYLWPVILVEESWNSYQQKAYNRSLGKVSTYRAPQLRYAYKPEVDVVRAMSYLEMCLYKDASDTVNSFYKIYEPLAKYLEGTLTRYSRDVLYYYNLARAGIKQDGPYDDFIQGTLKDPDTHLIYENINESKKENQVIESKFRGRAKDILLSTIADFQDSQRSMLGRIIRSKFKKFTVDIREALQELSYIKLEIIGRQKSAIYQGKELAGKRGDVEYLQRTKAQYFWNFRKEFWADELGDYVFALASECHNTSSGERQ